MNVKDSKVFTDEREAGGIEAREQTVMTNADYIRAMSDAELAVHFAELIYDHNNGTRYADDENLWLEWLQQSAWNGRD